MGVKQEYDKETLLGLMDEPMLTICGRMGRLKINLHQFIHGITNSWTKTPKGFNFFCKSRDHDRALMAWLTASSHFALDHPMAKRIRNSHAWREINEKDGLHILYLYGKPYDTYKKAMWFFSIHLDSVSACPSAHHVRSGHKICDLSTGGIDDFFIRVFSHWKKDLFSEE